MRNVFYIYKDNLNVLTKEELLSYLPCKMYNSWFNPRSLNKQKIIDYIFKNMGDDEVIKLIGQNVSPQRERNLTNWFKKNSYIKEITNKNGELEKVIFYHSSDKKDGKYIKIPFNHWNTKNK